MRKKWKGNYDACYQEALKYKTRSEFQKKCNRAYTIALEEGWLDDYWWFEKCINPYKDEINIVYAYVFNKHNSIYIGRTYRQKDRHIEHQYRGSVYNFSKEHNIEIPEPTILKGNLTLEESLYWEDFYVKKYKEDGWKLINTAKTGVKCGSVGSLKQGKNTKAKCYEIAKKYSTRGEFCENDRSAYNKALEKGWIDEYDWMEKPKTASKSVIRLTLNGNIIKAYESMGDAKRDGFTLSSVSQCCRGELNKHKNSKWVQDTVDNFLIEKMNRTIKNRENIAA